jgi:xanthine dehydrogenase accessory factor
MKELKEIIKSYHQAKEMNQQSALATVVMVDGSAYRRPGARMHIKDSGEFIGAISGGCLEGDALKKAQIVMFQQKSMVVTYDTTDEDDQKFGIGLGCNGIIQILMEPIHYTDPNNPIELLIKAVNQPDEFILTTFFSTVNALERQVGTKLYDLNKNFMPDLPLGLKSSFMAKWEAESPILSTNKYLLDLNENLFAFIERFNQQFNIVIFGAGNDVIPLVKILDVLGHSPIVIDGRPNYANFHRLPEAKQILISTAENAFNTFSLSSIDVVLLMTHNFEYEVKILEKIIHLNLPYIGILGPKKKTIKLFERLQLPSDLASLREKNIFAPIGLDIGAETSEEIALSIISELFTVLNCKQPSFLRDKDGPIHKI